MRKVLRTGQGHPVRFSSNKQTLLSWLWSMKTGVLEKRSGSKKNTLYLQNPSFSKEESFLTLWQYWQVFLEFRSFLCWAACCAAAAACCWAARAAAEVGVEGEDEAEPPGVPSLPDGNGRAPPPTGVPTGVEVNIDCCCCCMVGVLEPLFCMLETNTNIDSTLNYR